MAKSPGIFSGIRSPTACLACTQLLRIAREAGAGCTSCAKRWAEWGNEP